LELTTWIENIKTKVDQLQITAKKDQEQKYEDDHAIKRMRQQLDELNIKVEQSEQKVKEQHSAELNKMEQNIKRIMQETEGFKDYEKFSELVEENKRNVGRKVDEVKQKVEKIERGCFLTIQTQVDILREKVSKFSDSQTKQNKELNTILLHFEEERRKPKQKGEAIDYKKIANEISVSVDEKLRNYTESLEKKLVEIQEFQRRNDEAPESNFEGKKYVYIDQRGNPVDREQLRVAVDGSLVVRKNLPQGEREKVTKKHYQGKPGPRSSSPQPFYMLCKYGEACWNQNCNRKHQTTKGRGVNCPQTFNPREEEFIPFKQTNRKMSQIPHPQAHSFQQPPTFCKYGTSCWDRDCNKKHRYESKRDKEILSGLGFLGRLSQNPQRLSNGQNKGGPRDQEYYGGIYEDTQNLFQCRRNHPGVHIGTGGRLTHY